MSANRILKLVALSVVLIISAAPDAFAAKKHTLLVVMTHGDDVVSIAPLLAKSAAEGHTVYYAIFPGVDSPSGGEEGSPGRVELDCAARALGVKETFVMRGPAMRGPAGGDQPVIRAVAGRLIEIINQTRPDVIVTWGPDGVTGHPRHILVGNVVTRVLQQQAHLKHRPRKLYYVAYPESLFPETRLPYGVVAEGMSREANAAGPFGTVSDQFITTKVDGRPYLKQTRAAIACNTLPKGADNKRWQQEWYERIATTLGGTVFLRLVMPAARGSETDIFKGL